MRKTSAKQSFGRNLRRIARCHDRRHPSKSLRVEPLEDRRVLSINLASEATTFLEAQSLMTAGCGSGNAQLINELSSGAPTYPTGAFTTSAVTVGSTTTAVSSQQLEAFERVWQSLDSTDVLTVLFANGLVNSAFSDVSSLASALSTRGVDLSTLRPDGMLTAIATAPDPATSSTHTYVPLLTVSNAQQAQSVLLANFVNDPYTFLNPLPLTTLVGLFDNTFTNSSSTGTPLVVYPSADLRDFAGAVSTVPSDISGMIEMYPPGQWTNNPLSAARRSTNMGSVGQVVMYDHAFEILNNANWPSTYTSAPFLNGTIDEASTQISGSPFTSGSPWYLIWMDNWATDVASNLNSWLSSYESDSGAQITKFIMDFEDNSLGYQSLEQSAGRQISGITIPSGTTIWNAIVDDSRWAAAGGVRDMLIKAGMPQDFDNPSSADWMGNGWSNYDPKTLIWNSVMQQRYDQYLNTAILAPIEAHMGASGSGKAFAANVEITNYDSYDHSQTINVALPDFIEPSAGGLGDLFGNSSTGSGTTSAVPAAALYGSNSAIIAADQSAYMIPPSVNGLTSGTGAKTFDYHGPNDMIKSLAYTSVTSTSGTVVIHLNSKMYGIVPGDTIQILDNPSSPTLTGANAAYVNNPMVVTAVDNDLTHGPGGDDPTITATLNFTGSAPSSVSSINAWVYLDAQWKPFNAFYGDVATMRSQAAASTLRFEDFISDEDFLYTEWPMGWGSSSTENSGNFEYYGETVFQAIVNGAKDIEWWHGDAMASSKGGSGGANQANADYLHALLQEAEGITNSSSKSIVEDPNAKPISFEQPSASSDFVLSGIEGAGERLWRLSVDNVSSNISVSSSTSGGDVTFTITNSANSTSETVTIPNASIYTPSSPQSTRGYWIVQTSAASPISSVSSANSALANAIKPVVTNTTAVAGAAMTFTLGMDSALFGSSDRFTYTVDWGDGSSDTVVSDAIGVASGGTSLPTVNHTFASMGSHTVTVSAVEYGGNNHTFGTSMDTFTVSTYIVASTADSGTGTLRDAITAIDADVDGDTIGFALTGSSPYTISPSSALPTITKSVTIDGTTQSGYSGTPLIQLDGSSAGSTDGLTITAGNTTVEGLAIVNFHGNGITLSTGDGDTIASNYIGIDSAGAAHGNSGAGIEVESGSNIIGGTTSGAGNTISANSAGGILITGGSADYNVVGSNRIGTNAAGTSITDTGSTALGNGTAGIIILNDAADNVIGLDMDGSDTSGGGGNIIGGNLGAGVLLENNSSHDSTADVNIVAGNYIGTNSSSASLGNTQDGVYVNDAPTTLIGGLAAAAGNTILNNGHNGVHIAGADLLTAIVSGNDIGTNADGSHVVGNSEDGVLIEDGSTTAAQVIIVGAANLGDEDSPSWTLGNVIGGNAGAGVDVDNMAPDTTDGGIVAVLANDIGVLPSEDGPIAIGNAEGGALINNSSSTYFSSNLVGDNGTSETPAPGIHITGSDSINNVLLANQIGGDGTNNFGNTGDGLVIDSGANQNYVGTIDSDPTHANVISNNGGNGVTIDGSGTNLNVLVGNTIDANAADGVVLTGGSQTNYIGSTTSNQANDISDNTDHGVLVSGSSTTALINGNTITYNGSATDEDNAYAGVWLDDSGSVTVSDNVVLGNAYGIVVYGGGSTGQRTIQGNLVGVDGSGSLGTTQQEMGIAAAGGATNVLIGTDGTGDTSGTANTIVDAAFAGILLGDSGTSGNTIGGNFIGVNSSGTVVGSQAEGIYVDGATNNTIGGSSSAAANTIGGNTGTGIALTDGADDNTIQGNYIGIDASNHNIGNAYGIYVDGADGLSIGGSGSGQGNHIANNSGGGIVINSGVHDAIFGNMIFDNGYAGIYLASGANDDQVPPTVTSATIDGSGNLLVTLSVASDPASVDYGMSGLRIDFYSSDGSTIAQGETPITTGYYTSTDYSTGTVTINLGNAAALGVATTDNLVCTATDADGNTSVFTSAFTVT